MASFVVSCAVNFIIDGVKHLNFVDNDRVNTNLTKLQIPCEGTCVVLVVAHSEERVGINMLFCKIMKKEKY